MATATVKDATAALGRLFDEDVCSASVATKVHSRIYRLLKNDDPYEDLKKKSNEIALELYPLAERFVASSRNRLKAAFLCSVVGNVLDFGIGTGFDHPIMLKKEFRSLLDEGLGYDDTPKIRRLLGRGKNVAYLTDNCGEVVFDRLVLKELQRLGVETTLIVKEKPILTDATLKDIDGLGMESLVADVKEAPGFAVGIDIRALNGSFGKMLREHDLVIAKGMANYEAISETDIRPIAYLLRTKCRPVAESMGLAKDINAVKLFERGRNE